MSQYKDLQSLLNAALGDYQNHGFRLYGNTDDGTALFFKDVFVTRFGNNATIPAIQEACREYLKSLSQPFDPSYQHRLNILGAK